jgi:hypothetical protein
METASIRKLRVIALCMLLAGGCSGCITASLATIGTVLGAVGTAASTGADAYKLGKLDSALFCDARACHNAVLSSAVDLGLWVRSDGLDNRSGIIYEMALLDDQKSQVGIRIEQRSAMLTLCRVDVGIFGSEPTAKLVLERIRFHLHQLPTTNP